MEDSSKNAATMTTMRAIKRATTALATTRAVAMVAAVVPRASTTPSTTTKLTMVATSSSLSRVVDDPRLAMAVENSGEMELLRTIAAITRHRKMISVAQIKRSQDRLKLRRIHSPTWDLPRASIGSLRLASPLVRRFLAQLLETRDRVAEPEVVLWSRPATEVALPRTAKAARSV
mgnify:FL=1